MQQAIEEAKSATMRDEVPVGAVLVDYKTGEIIASGSNTVIEHSDPTAHAEINVIRAACKFNPSSFWERVRANLILGTPSPRPFPKARGKLHLDNCDIYITLEPCAMCAQAISNARIRRIYYGAYDPKSGGVDHGARVLESSSCHHKPEVYGGIMEEECGQLLSVFFKSKRC